jgi:predicted component of type VI protein secretion system
MNARLLVVLGNAIKREVTLHLPTVLGRSREADITVPHPLISRRHCEISEHNGLLMVRDLTSLNGTMIGGRRIESAALLPDAEFTIGPVMFRVLYEYDGDLESLPDTQFLDDVEGSTGAGLGDQASAVAVEMPILAAEEALPAPPANESHSDVLAAMPDLMALADVHDDEVLPVWPAPPAPGPAAGGGSPWPPPAIDKVPTVPPGRSPYEPLEFDSSLQSGSHRAESPWGAEPPAVEKLRQIARASMRKVPPPQPEKPPEAPAVEEPVKEKPPAANPPAVSPPKKSTYNDDMDTEFGSFLEGLQ